MHAHRAALTAAIATVALVVGTPVVCAAETQLAFTSDTTYSGFVGGAVPRLEMDATACTATFAGTWDGWGNGGTKSYWTLDSGAKILVAGAAHINNNDATLVNARPFFVNGSGLTDTVEFAPTFNADHMGYPDAWTNDGLSTLRVGGAVYVTHATMNLPTVHKKAANGNYTHHGLLVFTGAPASWLVRSAPQLYDGGMTWNVALTVQTDHDLTFEGTYSDEAKISFGTDGAEGATLVKRGPASMIVNMTPGHGPGSRIEIEEGTVSFLTNQGDPTQLQLDSPYRSTNAGQYLELVVGAGGTAELCADTNGLKSLDSEGALELRSIADVDITDNATFTADAVTRISADGSLPHIMVHGNAALAGALHIDSCTLADGSYTLLSTSGTLTGTFDDGALPPQLSLVYESQRVLLEVSGTVAVQRPNPSSLHRPSPAISIPTIAAFHRVSPPPAAHGYLLDGRITVLHDGRVHAAVPTVFDGAHPE